MYKGVEHSDSEDSDKSEFSDSEYASDEEQKVKESQDTMVAEKCEKKRAVKDQQSPSQDKECKPEGLAAVTSTMGDTVAPAIVTEPSSKEKQSIDLDKDPVEKSKAAPPILVPREKLQVKEEVRQPAPVEDSDSERELVIDLGEDQGGKERKRNRKDTTAAKDPPAIKTEGKSLLDTLCWTQYFG